LFIDTRPYLPSWAEDEVRDTIFSYRGIPGYIEDLQRERADIVAALMPRAGTSLVTTGRIKDGRVRDPTGDAAAKLASHPSIKKIDELIEYWRLRKERVDQLLPLLNDKERAVIELYISKASEVQWPSMGRKELQQTRRQIIEKAARLWGLVQ